jgi:predicted GNAT superfamily acetyltransferase
MPVTIRPADLVEYDAIRAINEHAVPAVSSISMVELSALAKQCCYFSVAIDERGAIAGFLMALRPGEAYRSENYRWFSEHLQEFRLR